MAARRSGSTARRRSWPRKRNQGIRRDSTCYGGAISSANTANDEWRVCGHGDGTRLRNTARSARGETAYRALLASQRGHGGAVGPRRSYCSGVGGTRCELRPAMATAKVPGTAAAAAVAAVSKGEGKAKCGARRLTGALGLELALSGPTWPERAGHRRRAAAWTTAMFTAGDRFRRRQRTKSIPTTSRTHRDN